MFECQVHFDETLQRFLYPRLKTGDPLITIRRSAEDAPIKDVIESCGIPHPLVDGIWVRNQWLPFDFVPVSRDRVLVFGVWKGSSMQSRGYSLQKRHFSTWRFALDGHLGKLARYLRLLGFDTWYENDVEDDRLIEIMDKEERILITRDRQLLMRRSVSHAYYPLSDNARKQLEELFDRFDLTEAVKPFSRCLLCNGHLKRAAKEQVLDELEPLTKKYYQDFAQCEDCERVYWEGSHFEKLDEVVAFVSRY